MRAHTIAMAAAVFAALGACSRTENGDVVVKRPADVNVKTTEDTLHLPSIQTTTDTVTTPVVGTKAETVVVKKPVIGAKKTVVKVPKIVKP